MDQKEQADLSTAQETVAKLTRTMYDMMVMISRMGPDEIRAAGHASFEAALKYTFQSTKKSVDKVWADHLRKYPDR